MLICWHVLASLGRLKIRNSVVGGSVAELCHYDRRRVVEVRQDSLLSHLRREDDTVVSAGGCFVFTSQHFRMAFSSGDACSHSHES